MSWRKLLHVFMVAASVTALGYPARMASADEFPNRLVTIIVPFSAGSTTDILARSIAERLSTTWKQSVIVENRPGIAGVGMAAKMAPDGYTLMLTSNGHTVLKAVNPTIAFDPAKDFVTISQVASMPSILIVPPESATTSVKALVDAAKAKPGSLNYSSAGLGSTTGIAAEMFKKASGTDILSVPYRGSPEAQTAVMRSDVSMAFTVWNVGGDLIQSGRLRALAVTGSRRMTQLPDVPTFAEAGLPNFDYDSWFGILAPAGVPQNVVDKVSRDIAAVLAAPDLQSRFRSQGVELISSAPDKFKQVLHGDIERYAPLFAKQ